MKKFLSSTTFVIILGVTIFLIGCIQPAKYEDAKENGYEVDATIVDVDIEHEDDLEGYSSTSYTLYANYEVNGKEYKHIKIGKYYDNDKYYIGKTVKVVVNPDSPDETMYEGGVLCVIGFLLAIGGIIIKIKSKKQDNTPNNAT